MLLRSLFIAMRSRNFLNALVLLFIGTSAPNVLIVYTDADYAMDWDNQRSKIDLVLFVNNTPVAWGWRKQLSSSTIEAKYVSVGTTTKEIVWLRTLSDKLSCLDQAPQSFIQKTRVQIVLFITPSIVIEPKCWDTISYSAWGSQEWFKSIAIPTYPWSDRRHLHQTSPFEPLCSTSCSLGCYNFPWKWEDVGCVCSMPPVPSESYDIRVRYYCKHWTLPAALILTWVLDSQRFQNVVFPPGVSCKWLIEVTAYELSCDQCVREIFATKYTLKQNMLCDAQKQKKKKSCVTMRLNDVPFI